MTSDEESARHAEALDLLKVLIFDLELFQVSLAEVQQDEAVRGDAETFAYMRGEASVANDVATLLKDILPELVSASSHDRVWERNIVFGGRRVDEFRARQAPAHDRVCSTENVTIAMPDRITG
jgi:hypothetical protein